MTSSEFALIDRYFSAADTRADVTLGVGDDCALLNVPPGRQLAVSMDVLVAGRHFMAADPPADIGHKALAVNLSDLAAMAAEPAWVTLGLTLPEVDHAWLEGFCQGFFTLAAQHRVQLVGGDTTRGPLALAVQAHGLVEPGRAPLRSGARPGDKIFVTGTPGDAGLALAGCAGVPAAWHDYLYRRLRRPTPRLAAGRDLAGLAGAAVDISDGLAQDLGHILSASQVGARLWPQRLPLSAAARACADRQRALTAALTGGDDYELCFTVAPQRLAIMQRRVAGWDCGCAEIGLIEAEPGLRLVDRDGTVLPPPGAGFDHFA